MTNVPQTNLQGGLEAPVETVTGQFIYIRIRNALLRPIPATATNPPANPEAPSHLYLIKGTYKDIQRYAGTTVDWIIKVARLCDPLGKGHVYTHTTGTSSDGIPWTERPAGDKWSRVVPMSRDL